MKKEESKISLYDDNLCRILAEMIPQAVFICFDNKFIYANKRALKLIKAECIEDIKYKNAIDYIHPHYTNDVIGRRVSKSGDRLLLDKIEAEFLCLDETVIDVEMESEVLILGDKLMTVTILKEKAKMEHAQEELLSKDVLIDAIFESTIDGILVVDNEGKLINVNSRFFEIWNLSYEDLLEADENTILSNILCNLEDVSQMQDIIARSNSLLNEYYDNIRFKNGRVLNFYSCPLIMNGEITGRIWSFRDITKQAEDEEKLNKLNAELSKTIERLRETQSQLIQKEKFAGIGQLAAGVAHEINNPLAYTKSDIDMLRDRINILVSLVQKHIKLTENMSEVSSFSKDSLDSNIELEKRDKINFIIEDISELINDSIEGLNRVAKIVSSLINFAGKRGTDKFVKYNLNEGIENTLTLIDSELKHRAEVIKEYGEIPIIKANSSELNQVILNLLQNSVYSIKQKNMGEMGKIKIKTYVAEKHIVCEIEDNGIGIEEKNIDKVFLPFFTTKDVGEGYGLGLSIAFDIITNKHNGEISVSSIFGQGAKFTIKIPI